MILALSDCTVLGTSNRFPLFRNNPFHRACCGYNPFPADRSTSLNEVPFMNPFAKAFALLIVALFGPISLAADQTVTLPYMQPDKDGNQWMVHFYGYLQQQGNMPVYSSTGVLTLNGNSTTGRMAISRNRPWPRFMSITSSASASPITTCNTTVDPV